MKYDIETVIKSASLLAEYLKDSVKSMSVERYSDTGTVKNCKFVLQNQNNSMRIENSRGFIKSIIIDKLEEDTSRSVIIIKTKTSLNYDVFAYTVLISLLAF